MIAALVEYVVNQLTEGQSPSSVRLEEAEGALIVHIVVDQKERGKIIGRDGQTIKALRAFLSGLVSPSVHVTIELTHPA
jgi:predicted RNA-binding protein YlqC (UPF0109 family)